MLAVEIDRCETPSGWERYIIGDLFLGAQTMDVADANGDGRVDVAVGFADSRVVAVFVQPENDPTSRWLSVVVNSVADGVPTSVVLRDMGA